MRITVKTRIVSPVALVWLAYTTPEDIKKWNSASDDWHTTSSFVELRVGGRFCSRMEAKDGSFGFNYFILFRLEEKVSSHFLVF